jgi:aminopeptidase S
MRRVMAALLPLVVMVACSAAPPGAPPTSSSPAASSSPADGTALPGGSLTAVPPSRTAAATPTPRATPEPAMNARTALRDIIHLASNLGPREATSDNFTEAAHFVQARFEALGYVVRRTRFRVPSGVSWGIPVRRGTSLNVIAEPKSFDAKQPHVVIGAHLDTVPVAPGAEDNASGVAVMLQLAAMVSQQPAALPVQFIAFGAEEPRGSGDALHHFGSRQQVADLSRSERRAIQAMVSLDRVGVRAGYVPICTATNRGTRLRDAIGAAARRAEITTRACTNYTSDHWSYAKAGVPAVRLGSIPYAGYHSAADVPRVVDRRQLDRVGRTVWAWLESLS